jgi:hypothetical protein
LVLRLSEGLGRAERTANMQSYTLHLPTACNRLLSGTNGAAARMRHHRPADRRLPAARQRRAPRNEPVVCHGIQLADCQAQHCRAKCEPRTESTRHAEEMCTAWNRYNLLCLVNRCELRLLTRAHWLEAMRSDLPRAQCCASLKQRLAYARNSAPTSRTVAPNE